MRILAEKLAQVNDLGLSIPGLWWTPERIAYHNGQGWKTVPWQKYTPKGQKMQTSAISPVGTDGLAYFIAWDVDSGNPRDVRAILEAMPKGIVPFVSTSGKKGWHCWLFPDRPLPTRICVAFAKLVRNKAGIACEVFPTSKRSRCLKWPGSLHPETGKTETFVREDDLATEYDTQAVLEGLAGGEWRTPAEVITAYVAANIPAGKRAREKTRMATRPQTTAKPQSPAIACNQLQSIAGKLVPGSRNLAAIPEIAFGLAQLCGRHISRIGQAFRCILPGHQERRPSAAFYAAKDGCILYHDFHQRDGSEWYTLGEVYHAITTGRVQKLRPVDSARWLCKLALQLGFETQTATTTKAKLHSLTFVLHSLGLTKQPTGKYICPVGCKTNGSVGFKAKKIKASEDSMLERVWQVFCEEAMISAMAGFEEVKLSKRFLAERAGIPADMANRAINLLAVLDVIRKTADSGGLKGDRFKLGAADEAEQRFKVLFGGGKVDLRKFNRGLVAKRLGEEIAAAVFRRQAETVKGTVTQTVSRTVIQTVSSEDIPCRKEAFGHGKAGKHHYSVGGL